MYRHNLISNLISNLYLILSCLVSRLVTLLHREEELHLKDAETTLSLANDTYQETLADAMMRWEERGKPGNFEDWWPEHFPRVGQDRQQVSAAEGRLRQLKFDIVRSDLEALSEYRKNIEEAQDTHNLRSP